MTPENLERAKLARRRLSNARRYTERVRLVLDYLASRPGELREAHLLRAIASARTFAVFAAHYGHLARPDLRLNLRAPNVC
jgi:hypothetical protein